jgi:signal transduction histidine kinase
VTSLQAKNGSVEIRIDPETEDFDLYLEAGKFLQVLTTLVFNAIEAMPKGGRVILGARRESTPKDDQLRKVSEYFTIYVRDQGSGIPKSEIAHIFKPFFKVKPETQGTGLGLAIAQGIVRDHGGWIDVESEVGVGSTFKVCLPEGGVTCKTDAS